MQNDDSLPNFLNYSQPMPLMPMAGDAPTHPPLLDGTSEGRSAFQQLVRDALATAAREGWRELLLVDSSFEDWPLGESAVIDSLNAWSKTGRSITLLARRYDTLIRTHHRFVAWRGRWSHIVNASAVPSTDELPSAILSRGWAMRRFDNVHCRIVAGHEAHHRIRLREELQHWLSQSSPSFPATTLGL
jgi:hypothetical protein